MRIISNLLTGTGTVLVIAAALSESATFQTLLERMQAGPGPFFADVELFGAIAFISGALGTAALFFGKKLKKRP